MRILNFGSLNVDTVFSVSHVAAAGESLSVPDPKIHAGGKGLNQSIAAARAGATVFHAGRTGPDGTFLLQLLAHNGVDISYVSVDPTAHCGGAIIQVEADGTNTMLIYGGANKQIDYAQMDAVLSHFGGGDMLMLQNETNLVRSILCRAAENGMYTIYNPSPVTPEIFDIPYEQVNLLIVNEDEAAALAGGDYPVETVLQRLYQICPNTVILTLGQRGSYAISEGTIYYQPIFPVKAADSTGAGDTFTGYIAAGLTRGDTLPQAMRIAAAASALSVTKHGAAASIPTRQDVDTFLASKD